MHHYMSVIASRGPLMILRVPWPMPRWKSILQATTPIMRSHGGYQKDISALDGLVPADPADRDGKDLALVDKLERAYAGGEGFEKFWLYDWSGFRGGMFRLVREGRT